MWVKFKSYAQNLEDLILWRALGKYGPGFYIDVGACDPYYDSVTKAFYDRGWRGINIEPVKHAYDLVNESRPRDINLNVAVDTLKGVKKFYSIDAGGGLSTINQHLAEAYQSEGRVVDVVDVHTLTLASICETFVNEDIHFLKVDVEGAELSVLQSADFNKFRPWVIVVEATKPNTQVPTHDLWETVLLASDYQFSYFDGLNRFYIANEKADLLLDGFAVPPNWFDNYERAANLDMAEQNAAFNIAMQKYDFPQCFEVSDMVGKVEFLMDSLEKCKTEASLQEANLKLELESCYQELYESSRHIGYLTRERMNALEAAREVDVLRRDLANSQAAVADLSKRIEAIMLSTSWRLMGPARRIVRLLKKMGGSK